MKSNIEGIDKYKLWLYSSCSNLNSINKLLSCYGSAENLYLNIDEAITAKLLGQRDSHLKYLKSINPEQLYSDVAERAVKKGIRVYFFGDTGYPERLYNCVEAPPVIFAMGHPIPQEMTTIGIVGTRNYSAHGAELADVYSYYLAKNNIVIVSGMAIGIDVISAKSALRSSIEPKYTTIAVLGSGVDIPTPAENTRAYNMILERGTVVSQFLPGAYPTRYTYPLRNKVIAALSDALLVIEAGKSSGSLITANCAIKYGKPIYTIPARITDRNFKGSNELIRKGLAICADDADVFPTQVFGNRIIQQIEVKDEISQNTASDTKTECKNKVEENTLFDKGLDENSKSIYNALKKGPSSIDELSTITNMDIRTLNNSLLDMELSGIVVQEMGRVYRIAESFGGNNGISRKKD